MNLHFLGIRRKESLLTLTSREPPPNQTANGKGSIFLVFQEIDCWWHVFHQLRWVWCSLSGRPPVHSKEFVRWQNPVLTWIFCQYHCFSTLLPYFVGEGKIFLGLDYCNQLPKALVKKYIWLDVMCVGLSHLLSRHQPSLLVHWKWD